ncbi:MAG: protein-glutamate O-methyltransferase [Thermodesulfobacteriota bacterium]
MAHAEQAAGGTKGRGRGAQAEGRAALSDKDFGRFAEFIHAECGIKLPPSKKTMLEARLQKRLRILGLPDFKSYADRVFQPGGADHELIHLIDAVTTNTTDFFREPRHFEYLSDVLLPQWRAGNRGREFKVWSAGCSLGMEPYTLSMVLSEFAARFSDFRFSIMATDISTQVLEKAARGIYTEDQVRAVPDSLKRKYFLRSKDRSRGLVRVVPELRRTVTFRRLNFMQEFGVKDKLDVVFCRNVIIYFDKPTQEGLLRRLTSCLHRGGHLFIGHSESLAGLSLPVEQAAPTIYRVAP